MSTGAKAPWRITSRVASLVLAGLMLAACANQAPAPRQAAERGGVRLPTKSEYMAACTADTRRTVDFVELTQKLLNLPEIDYSEKYKEKLLESYVRRLGRLAAGERLARRSEKEKAPAPRRQKYPKREMR